MRVERDDVDAAATPAREGAGREGKWIVGDVQVVQIPCVAAARLARRERSLVILALAV